MLKNVTIGTDAEVFMKYGDTVCSVIGLIGGSKKEPRDIGNKCFMQEDNILAEFNIPPITLKSEFVKYINYCKDWLEVNVPELEMHFSSSEIVEDFILYDSKANEFGCEPDCVVDLFPDRDDNTPDEHEAINVKRMSNLLRTSGFHIHFGYDNPNRETNREIVKLFEKYVTLPLMDKDLDIHNRRSMYGQSGSYREKPYGVECRSLGGYFIKDNEHIEMVWDCIHDVVSKYNEGERISKEEFAEIKNKVNKTVINKKVKQ